MGTRTELYCDLCRKDGPSWDLLLFNAGPDRIVGGSCGTNRAVHVCKWCAAVVTQEYAKVTTTTTATDICTQETP